MWRLPFLSSRISRWMVAKRYGMIQPEEATTKAVRAVFFIDPKGVIRAIIYYPLSLGRNFDEIYMGPRCLQTADAFGCFHPRGLASRRRCHRADGRILRNRQGQDGRKGRHGCARIGSSAPERSTRRCPGNGSEKVVAFRPARNRICSR